MTIWGSGVALKFLRVTLSRVTLPPGRDVIVG